MLKNYFFITLRNLIANKMYSAINIFGLAIGLTCVILIALFVSHETSYDRHWTAADRTYKVMRTFINQGGADLELATNAPQVAPLLKQDFPEFEQVVRIMNAGQTIVTDPNTNQPAYEDGIQFVDPEIYQVFDIPLLEGEWSSALGEPYQMVINETLAKKYFGDSSAVGQSLLIANQATVRITAVMEDLPENTHLSTQAFASISTTQRMFGENYLEAWGFNNFHTYVVVPENYNIDTFVRAIPDFQQRHIGENANDFSRFEVMPLTDIHLNSQRDNEITANGNVVIVYTFSAIAVFILLIACFNFMNLSTARSTSRAREVGLRKTLGADQGQIMLQFLGESLLLTLLAVLLAAALVQLILPWFNSTLNLNLAMDYGNNPQAILWLLTLAIVVGLAAGSYPAFYLASFPATKILKGELTRGSGGVSLRKSLVVVQFSISIGLIIAASIVYSQLRFAMSLDPGYAREQVLLYRGTAIEGLGSSYDAMKRELLRHPEILAVTAANLMPGDQNTNSDGVRYEGGPNEISGLPYLAVDFDFFETFGIELVSGRTFSEERATDLFVEPSEANPKTTASYIINQTAADLLGYDAESALNKWLEVNRAVDGSMGVRGPIIGVANDIYFSSIREAVKPLSYRVMSHDNPVRRFPNFRQMAIKVSGRNLPETLSAIESTWNSFLPNVPFRQEFLEQKLGALYLSEQRQGEIFAVFSGLAIVIAGLGLYGLASYLTGQRTREIGIRKVLGGSAWSIVTLLTRDFSKLVLIANVIAWPIAWYFMNGWLQNFAYRITIGPLVFILAGLIALVIASITVGALAAKTANMNPIRSLRHE